MSESPSSPVKRNLVDTEIVVQETQVSTVYSKILEWMKNEGCKITKQIEPKLIEATHGTSLTISFDSLKWKKKIVFLLNEDEKGTIVRMIINPPWYERFQSNENETTRKWLEFSKELWIALDVDFDQLYPPELFSHQTVVDEIHSKWKVTYLGLILFSLFFLYNSVRVLFLPDFEVLDYLSYFAFFYAFYGFIGAWQAKKRYNLLDINIPLKPDPNRLLKILCLLVVIGVVAGEYWVITAPVYVTYSDYGFNFQRERLWEKEETGILGEGDPDDRQGTLTLKGEDDSMIQVHWFPLEWAKEDYSIDESIDSGLNSVFTNIEEDDFEYEHRHSERITRYVYGHESRYENGSISWGEITLFYIEDTFVCDETDRIITLFYWTQNESALSYYDIMVESFQCH